MARAHGTCTCTYKAWLHALYCNCFSNRFLSEVVGNALYCVYTYPVNRLHVPCKPITLPAEGGVLFCVNHVMPQQNAPPSNMQLNRWSSLSVNRLVVTLDLYETFQRQKVVYGKQF